MCISRGSMKQSISKEAMEQNLVRREIAAMDREYAAIMRDNWGWRDGKDGGFSGFSRRGHAGRCSGEEKCAQEPRTRTAGADERTHGEPEVYPVTEATPAPCSLRVFTEKPSIGK